MTAEQFRDAALTQLRAEFPGQAFTPVPDDPTSVVTGAVRLNLSNARKRYDLSPKTDQALREIMKEYQVFWSTKELAGDFQFLCGSKASAPAPVHASGNRLG